MSSRRRTQNLLAHAVPALLAVMAVFLLSLAARAATISGYSVLVSRLKVNSVADHEIKFVTPTGVDAPSDTITVTYEADFNLASIAVGDIDLAVDTSAPTNDCAGAFTDKTLAGAAGLSPIWGVSVAGQVITFTAPTDAGAGEIPAGRCIRVRVGLNTTAGGVGTHQIVNPSAASTHVITIAGAFGDTGFAFVRPTDDDQVAVTAEVEGAAGGGGGGGGGQQNPPVIMNVRTLNLTETTVDVLWDTDIASSSNVNYGLTDVYGSDASANGSVFNHNVHVIGLAPGTTYHYRVRSTGVGGLEAISGDFIFTTPDTTAPVISNVRATAVTGTSARITWDTDEDADSKVEYGLTPLYGAMQAKAAFVNSHAVNLAGLVPETTYHFLVTSKDPSGNAASSADFTFTTADTIPPTISNIFVNAITETSARVNWATDELADSTVQYGLTDAYGATVRNGNLVANHQIALDGLVAGTLYHFSVSSADFFANGATSTDQTFTTLPDATPPSNVTNLTVTPGNGHNQLAWTNPPDLDFAGVRIQRSTLQHPANPAAGITVYDGAGTAMNDVGLVNGTRYYYTVFAYDASGNFATGAIGDGVPFGPPAPPLCGNAMCDPGEDHLLCPADCPALPPPPDGGLGRVNAELIRVFALNRVLELHKDPEGSYRILPRRALTFFIPLRAVANQPIASFMLDFASDRYLFARTAVAVPEEGYVVDVAAPASTGRVPATITATLEDGSVDTVTLQVRVEPFGLVKNSEDGQLLENATLRLQKHVGDWFDWDALPYRQVNPVETDAIGAFAFMAPPGRYRIIGTRDGYRLYTGAPFDLTTEVVNPTIELIALPLSIPDAIQPDASLPENVVHVAQALGAQGAYVAKVLTSEVINNPRVEAAATQVVAPVAAVATVAVVATAVQTGSLLNYLYFLITQPLLLIARRKRKGFGIVYNALTKLPVDLATVRLYRLPANRLARTIVTDREGRYAFIVEPGTYRIEASKPGFSFPSRYLVGRKADDRYLDLYHGEVIEVGTQGAVITANVPLDPLESFVSNRHLVWAALGRRVQNALAFSSVLMTLIAALLYRRPYLYGLVAAQFLLFLLFKRLARPRRPKSWGIIYDARTRKPIPFAIARILETQYNRTLESQVTDSKGRYNFLVGNNTYYVTVEKPGYEPTKTAAIELKSDAQDEKIVNRDIPMREKETD